ncbi:MAG TPA: hypothetical protein VNX01_02615 [Bacteroidia bacterium]|nr:hypothetical protein [Bacteroidia bacterium]
MNTKLNRILFGAFLLSALIFISCKKTEQAVSPPLPGNEFLTTIKWRFQNTANPHDTCWAVWRDSTVLSKPYKDTLKPIARLHANSTYALTVHIYDETQNPVNDITQEIGVQRQNYHLYFFYNSLGLCGVANQDATTNPANFKVTYEDHDSNNPPLPIGLTDQVATTYTVNGASSYCTGYLRHQPNSKNGTFAPGSTDSQVQMQIVIY